MFFFFRVIATVLLVASCANTPEQRETESWNELLEKYPREKFLTAIGEGATLEMAQQQALLNLSQNFSVRVTGTSQSSNRLTSVKTKEREEVETSMALNTNVRRHTDQLVQGAEVYPADLVRTTYRALAVLEKTKGRRILNNQLLELDSQINDALAESEQIGSNRLEAAGWLKRAIDLATIRRQRYQQLLVLGGTSLPFTPSKDKLKKQLYQHIRKLPFNIVFGKATPKKQHTPIINALAKAGIRQGEETGSSYRLVIEIDQQQPFSRDGWYWLTAQLRIGLYHLNNPQGELLWDIKSAARQQDQVQARLHTRLTETIESEIVDQLIALATELS